MNALRNSNRSFNHNSLSTFIKLYQVGFFVHVLSNGKIVESGDWKLALELENDGYGKYLN